MLSTVPDDPPLCTDEDVPPAVVGVAIWPPGAVVVVVAAAARSGCGLMGRSGSSGSVSFEYSFGEGTCKERRKGGVSE